MKPDEKAARELQAYKVGVHSHFFDRYSEQSFERAFHRAVREKPDGLLIAPVLPLIAEKLIPTIPKEIPYENVVLRETVKQRIMVPIDILTKDNVQYYQS